MCRIASLFLLQRLKGSMSGDECDFNNIEMRAVIECFYLQGKAPKEIHAILRETWGEHAPSYATIKNWVAQLKRGDFSTCNAPRPGRPKTVTTLEIIDQIHKLILEDRLISAKWIAEQLGISHERIGSNIHKDLAMWKLSVKWVPKCLNTDQKRKWCQSSEQIWNFFSMIQMISCRNWWPWTKLGYITMTRRQSNNQWSGSIAAHPTPKNSERKNPLENSHFDFFWIKTASSSLIIFQRAKLPTRSTTHLCWCNWRTFWMKNATGQEGHQGGPVFAWQCPGSPGTCNPKETDLPGLPVSWSPTLFSGSGPIGLPPVPWTENTIERSPFFIQHEGHCCRGDLVGRTTFWFFVSGLQKLEQWAKKCIELRGEYVE